MKLKFILHGTSEVSPKNSSSDPGLKPYKFTGPKHFSNPTLLGTLAYSGINPKNVAPEWVRYILKRIA